MTDTPTPLTPDQRAAARLRHETRYWTEADIYGYTAREAMLTDLAAYEAHAAWSDAEIARLRAGLEFYADFGSYTYERFRETDLRFEPLVVSDNGDRARRALAREEGRGE